MNNIISKTINKVFKEYRIIANSVIVILTITGSFLFLAGCEQTKKVKPVIIEDTRKTARSSESVNNLELAKLILKPKREELSITKDPFKPLNQKAYSISKMDSPMNTSDVKSFRFLGVSKDNGEYVAFLKNGSERGAFRLQDKLSGYTIKKIQNDTVILSNGSQIIKLKRGE
ncbi:MAG: hypothetical protein KKF78_00385 [Candidatus Omnitrophica bacterium]|nr:hypothetical protein [Candidatus Omnitrophota bacterium]MBU1995593.1 hypothetical protein [Candidatus Omnitrophota bacterium]